MVTTVCAGKKKEYSLYLKLKTSLLAQAVATMPKIVIDQLLKIKVFINRHLSCYSVSLWAFVFSVQKYHFWFSTSSVHSFEQY